MLHLEDRILKIMECGASQRTISELVNTALRNSVTRRALFAALDRAILRLSLSQEDRPERVRRERYYMARALLSSLESVFARGTISRPCIRALSDIFLGTVFIKGIHARRRFREKHGFRPPSFATISPTNACNLACKGCYAGEAYVRHALPFPVFDRVVSEIKSEFGSNFIVISGGEPFAYRDGNRTLYDILERHNDVYFMAYTNATMLDAAAARRLAGLGNFTPAISVEGFAAQTDERRGPGTHARIMRAMDALREAGVPFGVSATPTQLNADLLLSDEFIDFYFRRAGAFYGWYFQYMPIGRNPSMDLLVTPEQRRAMLERIWKLVIEEKVFIADFWNSGTASDGCMAAARGGGYFYVMWDGTVTPCVFIPFRSKQDGNLHQLYAEGKTVTDAIKSPLFTEIRAWQDAYWINQPPQKCGNLLTPCIIRDNCADFREIVRRTDAEPVDEGASCYLGLVDSGRMPEYNRRYRELVSPVWERDYLRAGS